MDRRAANKSLEKHGVTSNNKKIPNPATKKMLKRWSVLKIGVKESQIQDCIHVQTDPVRTEAHDSRFKPALLKTCR